MQAVQREISIEQMDKRSIHEGIEILEEGLRVICKDVEADQTQGSSQQRCSEILDQLTLAKIWLVKLNGTQIRPLLFSIQQSIMKLLRELQEKNVVPSPFVECEKGGVQAAFLQNAVKKIGPHYALGMSNTALFISIPSGLAHLWTVERLMEWIKSIGIQTPVKTQNLHNLFKQKGFDRLMPVSHAEEPTAGTPAVLEDHTGILRQKYGFLQVKSNQSSEQFKGKTAPFFRFIQQGKAVIRKKPCVKGKAGQDIFGFEIPPVPPMDTPLPYVENGGVEEDGLTVRAKADGCVYESGKRIRIEPAATVSPDELHHAIQADGSLYIQGNCPGDASVVCGRHVFIQGGIEGSRIQTEGSLFCSKGIEGMKKSHIHAGEHIRCLYIHQANVTAGETVTCEKEMIQSEVGAKRVYLTGKKAKLFGGVIHAWNEVSVDIIGSDADIHTAIVMGEELDGLKQELRQLRSEIAEKKERHKTVFSAYHNLKEKQKKFGSLLPEQERELERRAKQVKEVEQQTQPLEQRLQQVQTEIEQSRNDGRRVVVRRKVYPKTEVTILDQSYSVTEEMGPVVFEWQNGKITTQPL